MVAGIAMQATLTLYPIHLPHRTGLVVALRLLPWGPLVGPPSPSGIPLVVPVPDIPRLKLPLKDSGPQGGMLPATPR